MQKNDFESQNFAIFLEVVDNFGRSDDDMIYREKMPNSNTCILGFNAQLDQKSWTVSTFDPKGRSV